MRWTAPLLALTLLGCGRTAAFEGIPGRVLEPLFVLVDADGEGRCSRAGDPSELIPGEGEELLTLQKLRSSPNGCANILGGIALRSRDGRDLFMGELCGVGISDFAAEAGVILFAADDVIRRAGLSCPLSVSGTEVTPSPGHARAVAAFATDEEADEALRRWGR